MLLTQPIVFSTQLLQNLLGLWWCPYHRVSSTAHNMLPQTSAPVPRSMLQFTSTSFTSNEAFQQFCNAGCNSGDKRIVNFH